MAIHLYLELTLKLHYKYDYQWHKLLADGFAWHSWQLYHLNN